MDLSLSFISISRTKKKEKKRGQGRRLVRGNFEDEKSALLMSAHLHYKAQSLCYHDAESLPTNSGVCFTYMLTNIRRSDGAANSPALLHKGPPKIRNVTTECPDPVLPRRTRLKAENFLSKLPQRRRRSRRRDTSLVCLLFSPRSCRRAALNGEACRRENRRSKPSRLFHLIPPKYPVGDADGRGGLRRLQTIFIEKIK